MGNRNIVVTGANSYLGQSLLRQLSRNSGYKITAFVSPRAADVDVALSGENIETIRADLTAPLDRNATEAFSQADVIFHFAWHRDPDFGTALQANMQVLENAFEHIQNPEGFLFFSSSAAASDAPSTYGVVKYKAERFVLRKGGKIAVCGLVVDQSEPGTAFRTLLDLVRKYPLDFRIIGSQPKVYLIAMSDLLAYLGRFAESHEIVSPIGLFLPIGVPLGTLFSNLKKLCPHWRAPVPVHIPSLRLLAKLIGATPWKLSAERLHTFLFDNSRRLERLQCLADSELAESIRFVGCRAAASDPTKAV